MRKLTLALMRTAVAMAALARGAGAAEKGQITLDVAARTASYRDASGTRPVEFFPRLSYQLSDRVSVRPLLGLGNSSIGGWSYDLGGEASYRFRPGKSWTPYLSGAFAYHHRPALDRELLETGVSSFGPRNYMTYTAAAGLEYTISRRFGLFTELRVTRGQGGEPGTELQPIVGFRVKAR